MNSATVVLRRLQKGGKVTTDALIEHLYGASGGPMTAVHCIRTHVHRLRREGIPVKSSTGRGRGAYWL